MKPIVLWLSDCKGWAFDIRYKQLKEKLDSFTHKTLYIGEPILKSVFDGRVAEADVIIVPTALLKYVEHLKDKSKIITLVSSLRSIGNVQSCIYKQL